MTAIWRMGFLGCVLGFTGLLVAFGATAATANPAHPSCTGTSIVSQLEADYPEVYANLEREARAIPNGEGLLWRITAPDGKTSYLFGTIHLSELSVPEISPTVLDLVLQSQLVVTEIPDIANETIVAEQSVLQMGNLFLGNGKTLKDFMSPQAYGNLERLMTDMGLPPFALIGFRPFVVTALISIPSCELPGMLESTGGMNNTVDVRIASAAEAAGIPTTGLESFAEQMEAITNIPLAEGVKMLETLVLHEDQIEDFAATLVALYDAERMDQMLALERIEMPFAPLADIPEGFAKSMIVDRNRRMAERSLPYVSEGGAFIAVGALHLPGKEGLVALFRESGFEVERVLLQ
ncbi:TraB/GumN family protein [Pararhizobium sp. IMCC21322]|uniref:TraB/GumN family protein n=1 Tax=Pararhizobium sp. IMCC21322 TaxID=3067903 RepID=UPI002740398D|nr:TraB/GumN family protein [Pararhizobium sp. IMCC21322]